jgi:hypothetical protein
MRMRPSNFPTIRLAQFAALIHQSLHLFSQIIETSSIKEISPLLEVTASEYWDTHYRFKSAPAKAAPKSLGKDSIDNIIINTIAPVQFLYAHYHGKTMQQEQALQLLASVGAESNKYVSLWKDNNWKPANAAESQALLQLFSSYCTNKKCLECAIGLNIIKGQKQESQRLSMR